jgi:hypothetical protein
VFYEAGDKLMSLVPHNALSLPWGLIVLKLSPVTSMMILIINISRSARQAVLLTQKNQKYANAKTSGNPSQPRHACKERYHNKTVSPRIENKT